AVTGLADDVEVGVQFPVALVDRVEVGLGELLAGDLVAPEEAYGLFRGEAKRVDHSHVSRGRRWPPSASSVRRSSAREARRLHRNRVIRPSPQPARETPRPPDPAHSPAPPRATTTGAARPRPPPFRNTRDGW